MPQSFPTLFFRKARAQGDAVAILHQEQTFTFQQLITAAQHSAAVLLAGLESLEGRPVAFLVPPGFDAVATTLGIWRAGGVAMPMPLVASPWELWLMIDHSRPAAVISAPAQVRQLPPLPLGTRQLSTVETVPGAAEPLPKTKPIAEALQIFTPSLETASPVLVSHDELQKEAEDFTYDTTSDTPHVPMERPQKIMESNTADATRLALLLLWHGRTCEFSPQ